MYEVHLPQSSTLEKLSFSDLIKVEKENKKQKVKGKKGLQKDFKRSNLNYKHKMNYELE